MMNESIKLTGEALARKLDHEWLLTDGKGGFAMGTVSGMPQRRYHALLIDATKPPVGRIALVQALADWAVFSKPGSPDVRIPLTCFEFEGSAPEKAGGAELTEFELVNSHSAILSGPTTAWTYRITTGFATVTLNKLWTLASDGTRINYLLMEASELNGWSLRIEARPLLSLRDFHELRTGGSLVPRFQTPPAFDQRLAQDHGWGAPIQPPGRFYVDEGATQLWATAVLGEFVDAFETWRNIRYRRDAARGQECSEDLISPGLFRFGAWTNDSRSETLGLLVLAGGSNARLAAARWMALLNDAPELDADAECDPDVDDAEMDETEDDLAFMAEYNAVTAPDRHERPRDTFAYLRNAAAQFIVRRDTPAGPKPSVIAGYPWFSDWGRDTMISLPGLFLVTGRYTEARDTLLAFAALMQDGLIPNCFDNGSGEAEYNTVDASLWFIQAACNLADATKAPLPSELVNACRSIIAAYTNGTRFNIRMDPADSLIAAGDHSTQLTWMDARRNGVVFTPRHGKPVEINALWHSGLVRFASLIAASHPAESAALQARAARVAESFRAAFWNSKDACLFDCLTPNGASWTPDPAIRPNQLFAVSLPHSPLSADQQRAVVACATKHLLTPVGLRTLAPGSPGYRPRFEGDLFSRDGAYHNGTVWPWLIGPYIEALLRAHNFSDAARVQARAALQPLLDEFNGTGPTTQSIASIAEVYDADDSPNQPRRPDGCPMQAWSVAEVLRAYSLINTP